MSFFEDPRRFPTFRINESPSAAYPVRSSHLRRPESSILSLWKHRNWRYLFYRCVSVLFISSVLCPRPCFWSSWVHSTLLEAVARYHGCWAHCAIQ